jgi:hypothetical protein
MDGRHIDSLGRRLRKSERTNEHCDFSSSRQWSSFCKVAWPQASSPHFLIAALLCLFPPFLDYYGFAIDHIEFVFGDTLLIFGAYLLKRGTLLSVFTSSLLYELSLAVYGPKISFVSFTAISSIILRATEANPSNTTTKNGSMLRELLVPALLSSSGNDNLLDNLQALGTIFSRNPHSHQQFRGSDPRIFKIILNYSKFEVIDSIVLIH